MSAPREHVVGQILALGTDEVPFTPSADEMKAPVRQVLEQAGWAPRRRGLWDRLTSR